MAKHKSPGKEKDKGSQLVLRVEKSERTAFIKLCKQLDTSAAREIRRFMREFVAAHAQPAPVEMLATEDAISPDELIAPGAVPAEAEIAAAVTEPVASDATSVEAAPDDTAKPRKPRRRAPQ